MARLRDPALAKDVMQETFLAAIKSQSSFAGTSSERGWLMGILKHKIHDHYRKAARVMLLADLEFYAQQEKTTFVEDGLHQGTWVPDHAPSHWEMTPEQGLDRKEFWREFHACAGKLPQKISQVFLMRELDGVETPEICAMLGLSESNVWVMLHRARLALRRCLEKNWFAK